MKLQKRYGGRSACQATDRRSARPTEPPIPAPTSANTVAIAESHRPNRTTLNATTGTPTASPIANHARGRATLNRPAAATSAAAVTPASSHVVRESTYAIQVPAARPATTAAPSSRKPLPLSLMARGSCPGSISPQRFHGIHPCRPPRWNPARDERKCKQCERRPAERHGIRRSDLVEQRFQKPREPDDENQSY